MSQIILPKAWHVPQKEITPESVFNNRRHFLKLMGFTAAGIAGALLAPPAFANSAGSKLAEKLFQDNQNSALPYFPNLKRSPDYTIRRPMTDEKVALKYNNFYEFSSEKDRVWQSIDAFEPRPWEIEIGGLVENPGKYSIDDFIKTFNLEERVYRHRCVETWAMVVPWNGFPMSDLIDQVQPKSNSRYVKFTSFDDPEAAPGQKRFNDLPWPYTEALTMSEAMNELTFIGTGVYGHILPKQHGAPIRLVTPWKYGFKSIKSIVKIEFTDSRPATFWNTLIPREYDFEANVNPDVPHPRWSQRREKMIGTGEIFATQKYNGYGDFVAELYA
ncbi:MAG: mononuclear molybdenum enzyme YedY [Nitrospinaceae bacterium]|nr:MAG: mononuclear molybdenum enzyme YedY [Nitrospinaceae bacterium]